MQAGKGKDQQRTRRLGGSGQSPSRLHFSGRCGCPLWQVPESRSRSLQEPMGSTGMSHPQMEGPVGGSPGSSLESEVTISPASEERGHKPRAPEMEGMGVIVQEHLRVRRGGREKGDSSVPPYLILFLEFSLPSPQPRGCLPFGISSTLSFELHSELIPLTLPHSVL